MTTKTVSAQSWWGLPSEPQLDARPEGEVEVEVQEEPTPKAPRYEKGTRWEWFALHTADSDLIFRLSVALELKSKQTQRASPAVQWDSLCEMPDGFALRWLSPALIRAGHMWWSRILKKIPRSKTAGWHVQGYHADPGEARPGQQPIPGAMASSTAMAPPPHRDRIASSCRGAGPCGTGHRFLAEIPSASLDCGVDRERKCRVRCGCKGVQAR